MRTTAATHQRRTAVHRTHSEPDQVPRRQDNGVPRRLHSPSHSAKLNHRFPFAEERRRAGPPAGPSPFNRCRLAAAALPLPLAWTLPLAACRGRRCAADVLPLPLPLAAAACRLPLAAAVAAVVRRRSCRLPLAAAAAAGLRPVSSVHVQRLVGSPWCPAPKGAVVVILGDWFAQDDGGPLRGRVSCCVVVGGVRLPGAHRCTAKAISVGLFPHTDGRRDPCDRLHPMPTAPLVVRLTAGERAPGTSWIRGARGRGCWQPPTALNLPGHTQRPTEGPTAQYQSQPRPDINTAPRGEAQRSRASIGGSRYEKGLTPLAPRCTRWTFVHRSHTCPCLCPANGWYGTNSFTRGDLLKMPWPPAPGQRQTHPLLQRGVQGNGDETSAPGPAGG